MVPALTDMPAGCRFNNRCPHADATCASVSPDIADPGDGHRVACLKWRDLAVAR
jgi:oligopeptide/dipeptide ABC transporter ATP-binding protein